MIAAHFYLSEKNIFYIPLVALIVISLIYRSEFGLKSVFCSGLFRAAVLSIAFTLKFQPMIFIAFQAILGSIIFIHVKKNQTF